MKIRNQTTLMDDVGIKTSSEDIIGINLDGENDDIKIVKQPLKIKRGFSRFTPKVFQKKQNEEVKVKKQEPEMFNDKTFEMFSNPEKRREEEEEEDDDDENDDEEEDYDNKSIESEGYNGNDQYTEEPSPGFATIDDEKQDLLYKFHRIETKGVKLVKKFNMYSDIREMRAEYNKIKKDSEIGSSIKFSKKLLMAIVSGAEFLNKRYDPVGAELNGWSESVMETVNDGDYDNVLEKLHNKYSGKVDTPPEIELMLSLGGSAVMFHISSSMFKNIPDIGKMAKGNPEMMQNIMKSVNDTMKTQSARTEPTEPTFDDSGRKEMNAPPMNLSSFLSAPMMSTMTDLTSNFQNMKSDSESEITISETSETTSLKNIAVSESGSRKRGRKANINKTKDNTINL